MLVEVYVILLLSHFLDCSQHLFPWQLASPFEGKNAQRECSCRLDHLVYVLVHQVILYFVTKHCRQHFGFEGPDLELQHRQDIKACAKSRYHQRGYRGRNLLGPLAVKSCTQIYHEHWRIYLWMHWLRLCFILKSRLCRHIFQSLSIPAYLHPSSHHFLGLTKIVRGL